MNWISPILLLTLGEFLVFKYLTLHSFSVLDVELCNDSSLLNTGLWLVYHQ